MNLCDLQLSTSVFITVYQLNWLSPYFFFTSLDFTNETNVDLYFFKATYILNKEKSIPKGWASCHERLCALINYICNSNNIYKFPLALCINLKIRYDYIQNPSIIIWWNTGITNLK